MRTLPHRMGFSHLAASQLLFIDSSHILCNAERGGGKSLAAERYRELHALAQPIRSLNADYIFIDDWQPEPVARWKFPSAHSVQSLVAEHMIHNWLRPPLDPLDSLIESIHAAFHPKPPERDWADWLNQRFGLLPRIK